MTDQVPRPRAAPSAAAVTDVAAAVLAHPAVLRLDGGPFGSIASHLPGRRVAGVRIGEHGEPTEVAVVVRLGRPLPVLADELGARVRAVLGAVPVEVTFADVGAPEVVDPPGPSGAGLA